MVSRLQPLASKLPAVSGWRVPSGASTVANPGRSTAADLAMAAAEHPRNAKLIKNTCMRSNGGIEFTPGSAKFMGDIGSDAIATYFVCF